MTKSRSGFTIVELLIVIVVIAILAAISVVAFVGIQMRARESVATNSLQQTARKISVWRVDNGESATPANLAGIAVDSSPKIGYQYLRQNSDANYCITITVDSAVSYYINDTTQKTPTKGACAGHIDAGLPAPSGIAFTDNSHWTTTAGPGSKTENDEVWAVYMTGFTGWGNGNLYSTTARPIAQLNGLDVSWQVSTSATGPGTQYFDVAVLRGNISPDPNYGGWDSNSARASVNYTGAGVWQTVRWQSTLSGNTLNWSVTKEGVSIGSGSKDISSWSSTGWRLVPINSFGNRDNTRAGVKGLVELP